MSDCCAFYRGEVYFAPEGGVLRHVGNVGELKITPVRDPSEPLSGSETLSCCGYLSCGLTLSLSCMDARNMALALAGSTSDQSGGAFSSAYAVGGHRQGTAFLYGKRLAEASITVAVSGQPLVRGTDFTADATKVVLLKDVAAGAVVTVTGTAVGRSLLHAGNACQTRGRIYYEGDNAFGGAITVDIPSVEFMHTDLFNLISDGEAEKFVLNANVMPVAGEWFTVEQISSDRAC